MPDQNTLFSGALDKSIRMWDIKTASLIKVFAMGHSNHITKVHLYS